MLSGKRVLVGITGGIAAYKICELIRMFKRQNADVRVVVTPNALNFVTKLTLQCLSQNDVYCEAFNVPEWKPEHIALTESDIFIIAPCSANTIGKLANGLADNLLTSTAMAFKNPILIAPAMNDGMWENKILQDNLERLKKAGYEIIEPETGFLACGSQGKGRLADLNKIFDKVVLFLNTSPIDREVCSQFEMNEKIRKQNEGCYCEKINNKKILVTAGGTKEKIDPVRYITNNSSGKMGLAIADYLYSKGADVTLVSTFEIERPYKVTVAKSADEMFKTVKTIDFDAVFMTAAVGDFKVKNVSEQKIKKTDGNGLNLELEQNPDILRYLAENKKTGQTIVGFCAESENLIENAKEKIKKKGCDYLVANDISRKDIGFDSNENEVYILDRELNIKKFDKASKTLIAKGIVDYIWQN
ncbi:bifunctional phosphopantothenoylcysteine decarboxylase/phosphopantothenate--cysteine ligase CoaBC [bacterium]|nr:bifunctional phosphopantothenoylcysteine decarboxylase/phosphopantothenate--cysteine ligase CoaBC [bacterium]